MCAALSVTLGMGIFSACAGTSENNNEEEELPPLPADTQVIKNGNFEFFNDMTKKEKTERRDLINAPTSWTFSSGSPSSNAASGIVNADEWTSLTKSSYSLIPESERNTTDDEGNTVPVKSGTLSTSVANSAVEHWDEASIYDRLEFYDFYGISSSSAFELYDDYKYGISFKDVKDLATEVGTELKLYDDAKLEEEDADGNEKTPETGVLMIHNHRTSEYTRGTAQSYTSGTTITLNAGTAAEVSVWVKTMSLYHFSTENASESDDENDIKVTKGAGAYIGVKQTVGGNDVGDMQIKNIITEKDEAAAEEHNGWQKYTVYIRANTFATTTFRIVLGLGQGTSDDRYYAVDGVALFDDVTCKIIDEAAFEDATEGLSPGTTLCTLEDSGDAKKFSATDEHSGDFKDNYVYAIDLKADFDPYDITEVDNDSDVGLTVERSGSNIYTSAKKYPSLDDSRGEDENVVGKFTYGELKTQAANNGYLRTILNDDFKAFEGTDPLFGGDIVMLLSVNGAAYTAKLPEQRVEAHERLLISFFVKTSDIRDGKMGGGAILVEETGKSTSSPTITPFNSLDVPTVDIDDDVKDIYDGWVQCFFFIENDTKTAKTFHIELTYGPTSIASSSRSDYSDGYAAFANFQTCSLTKTQYEYASSGASSYSQKVSLTAAVEDASRFDTASASGNTLEEGLAIPSNYNGVLAGSNVLATDGVKNPNLEELIKDYNVYTGLLAKKYEEEYRTNGADWQKALSGLFQNPADDAWWTTIFGNNSVSDPAYQPLVIYNAGEKAAPSYGYTSGKMSFGTNTTTLVSLRVKLSSNAKAYLYLIDVSDPAAGYTDTLVSTLPTVTYWKGGDGNIVHGDPTADDYDEKTGVAYYLQSNGLYTKAGETDGTYYANLLSYEHDKNETKGEDNLVTKSNKIAFYGVIGEDGNSTYYAYRDGEEGNYTYRCPVEQLPYGTDNDFVRYGGLEARKTLIEIDGSKASAGSWINVSFYIQTGNEAKDYRLELWAGDRDNDTDGIPAKSYVFFDRCSTASTSDYAGERDAAVSALKEKLNEGKRPGAEGYLGEKDNLPADYATYYTFTFYDSPDYLRYDKDTDDSGIDPWNSYVQSEKTETLVYLRFEDLDGSLLEGQPSYQLFLSYAENEQTVEADTLPDDSESDSGSSDSTDTDETGGNVWLYLASALLVAALVLTIVALIVRRLWSKRRKSVKVKAPKARRPVKEKRAETSSEPAPEKAPEEKDENDPYNE